MDAITNASAQPRPVQSLTQYFLALSRTFGRDVGPSDEIAPQQCGQSMRVQSICFNLRIGNQPRFKRMSQHHFLNGVDLFKQIVDAAPVPTRLQHHLAWALQRSKKLSETR